MDMQPLVSVIIPVYKVEKYLKTCLESVLAQTYSNLEIILVDDGSPDNCPAICDAYAQMDSRIIVIHQKNGGLSAARNAGLERMGGAYVTFIDSDDFVHREYIEKLLRPCLEQKAEVTIGSFQKVQENAELIGHADTALTGVETRGATGLEANYRLCDSKDRDWLRTTVAWGKLIKRELIVKIRFPVGMLHEDEATSYRYLYEAAKVVYVDAVIYFYRDTPGSIMNSKFSDKNLDYLDILDERSWFYLSCGEQELADKTIWQCYWTILDFCYKTLQEDEKRPGRIKRLRMAMIRLCKMALRRSSIPGRTKIRYLISVPFMKAVSRHYNLK